MVQQLTHLPAVLGSGMIEQGQHDVISGWESAQIASAPDA
jgi:hypothetical protein